MKSYLRLTFVKCWRIWFMNPSFNSSSDRIVRFVNFTSEISTHKLFTFLLMRSLLPKGIWLSPAQRFMAHWTFKRAADFSHVYNQVQLGASLGTRAKAAIIRDFSFSLVLDFHKALRAGRRSLFQMYTHPPTAVYLKSQARGSENSWIIDRCFWKREKNHWVINKSFVTS